MSAPEVLFNSLNPTALDQTLGCMTGLFHIFEGYPAFMGRRDSSTRVDIHRGQAQLKTQTDSQSYRHDRRQNSFSKVVDTHKIAVHHRSHSDVSDLTVTPSQAPTDFRTLKDGNGSGQIDPTPAYSEGTVDALAFYNNESLRAAALFAGDPRRRSDLDHREYSKRNVVLPKARLVDNDVPSSDIRDAILASFQVEIERPKSTKSNSNQSLNSSCNQGSTKNRRDGCQKVRTVSVSRKSVDLPRSSSVYARSYEPTEIVNWKDGLRSSASPPRKLGHHNSPERRVEPKKDRGGPLSKDHYPFASMSPKRFPGSQGPNPQDRRHGEILNQDHNFKESPGASDFRESLRPFLTGAHERRSVPAQESFASRSGDSNGFSESHLVAVSHQMFNREAESNEHSVVPNVIARLMGLEEISNSNQQCIPSSKVPDAKSRGDKFFRGLVQFDPQIMRPTSPPPPPPYQSKKYVVHHLEQPSAYYKEEYGIEEDYQDNYPDQYKLEQGLCSCDEDRDYEHLNSMSFLPFEDKHQEGAHPAPKQLAESRKLADPITQAEDMNIVAPEKKKKMIRKILEAMRPKALHKISRRKQTEQEISSVTKLITNDVQPVQELFQEKQQQTALIKVVTGLKLPSGTENEEPPRYTISDTSSVKQVQEQQTDSSNSSEASVEKPCILQPVENKIVVMKPNTRSQDSNAGIFQVRHVETASSTSTDKEMVRTRRTAQINNEDWNLAKDQRRAMKPVKPRAASDNAPRSVRAKSTLESDYESDPSSYTQNDKSNDFRGFRKIRTTTSKRNPSSKSLTPNIQRQNGRCLSPEARSSCRSSQSKDHCKTGEVGKKSVVPKAKKDSRLIPTNPKVHLAKRETLKQRVAENPNNSRLCGSRLENKPTLTNSEKPAAREKNSIRNTSARPRSPAAPKKLDVHRLLTTDAVTLDTSDASNSALLQPASAQPQTSESKTILEHLVTVQAEPERSKDVHVYLRHVSPEVQKTEGDSVGDHFGDTSEPENLEACSTFPDGTQALLQAQKARTEVSEELTTPKAGIPLHCDNLDGKLDEGLDRPSPISVLDINTFEEELSPSPSSPRYSFPVLQDSATTYNDERCESCDKDLEAYHETPSALIGNGLDFDGLFSKCAEGLRAQVEKTDTKDRLDRFQSYFEDAELDEERAFVESFLLAPKVATSCRLQDSSMIDSCVSDKFKTKPSRFDLTDTENINKKLLESLQSNGVLQENNHILLFDCLEEIMERILESQSNLMLWAGFPPETICERTKGKQLEQELWIELRDIKCTRSSGDICDTVHRLLQRELIKCQGRQWSTFNKDREQIGIDMETMIVEDLIEEAVRDLGALQWRHPPLPLRQPGDSCLQTNY